MFKQRITTRNSAMPLNPLQLKGSSIRIERLESRLLLDGMPIGPEIQVNSFTTDSQYHSVIAMDNNGDFVVAWNSNGQDGDGHGVFAQRFRADGVPQGSEFAVNTYTTSTQWFPAIARADQGAFVIVWDDEVQDGSQGGIYARRYNQAGVAQGSEFLVNSTTLSDQSYASVAMDSAGNFVIAWHYLEQNGPLRNVYARRFSSLGQPLGSEFRVNTYTTGYQEFPAIAMDDSGDFVIVWVSSNQDGSGDGIFGQRYNSSGQPVGGEFRVNGYTTNSQALPAVAMDADGDFIATWWSANQDGSGTGVYARRFDAAGNALGFDFRANTDTQGNQTVPQVAMDSAGAFVITWQGPAQDGSTATAYAQQYDAAGQRLGTEMTLNTYTPNAQNYPDIAMHPDGDFVVTWGSNGQDGSGYGTYAQRYNFYPEVTLSQVLVNSAPLMLAFSFDSNVSASLGLNDIVVTSLSNGTTMPISGASYTNATNIWSITLSGIYPDGNYRVVLNAAGITRAGGPMFANHIFDFFILAGDANRDRTVDVRDLYILSTNWLASGKTFFQGDFNYDGITNASDLTLLARNWNRRLDPAPPPAPPATPTIAGRAPVRTPIRTLALVDV